LRATRLGESLRKKVDGERRELRVGVRINHFIVTFGASGDVRAAWARGDGERDVKMWWLKAKSSSLPVPSYVGQQA
jgi:hypothetical protein